MTRDYTMADFRAEMRRRGVTDDAPRTKTHGATITAIVPCAVHPLHAVKVRASGARSGCPMCAMQIEDVCRALSAAPAKPREHRPRVLLDPRTGTRIIGCTCGWETPAGTTDSDDAYSWHLALERTVAR